MINLGIAQINTKVGDFDLNFQKIKDFSLRLSNESHIIVFPELSLVGYIPLDFLFKRNFIDKSRIYLDKVLNFSKSLDSVLVIGSIFEDIFLYNALFVIYKGDILGIYKKRFLPNYGVFDEKRYFKEGDSSLILSINNVKIGFSICEDIWYPDFSEREEAINGATLIININASPFEIKKFEKKKSFLRARAIDNFCYIAYVNLVGANDELIFDGRSLLIDPSGDIISQAKAFEEDSFTLNIDITKALRKRSLEPRLKEYKLSEKYEKLKEAASLVLESKNFKNEKSSFKDLSKEEEIFKALTLGIKDYFEKQGFKKAIVGLSGGIDSGLVLTLACFSLSKENVRAIYMPTAFNSESSLKDVKELCKNLSLELDIIPIDDILGSYKKALISYGSDILDSALENIQARIRMSTLFYIANKENALVLSTSNKSESATGYTTIYGDMAGGLSPIKDLYKTEIYQLANFINQNFGNIIPKSIIIKPPSAELRPNQKDEDTLGKYEILDKILKLYIEENYSEEEIIKEGFDKDYVERVISMIKKSEYKRKQAPLGLKLHPVAFGRDWRYPIVAY